MDRYPRWIVRLIFGILGRTINKKVHTIMSNNVADAVPDSTPLSEIKQLSEIRNLDASTRKIRWEAANAKAQHRELSRKRNFYERILSTTQITIVLALVTLLFQIIQFGYTAHQSRVADEN